MKPRYLIRYFGAGTSQDHSYWVQCNAKWVWSGLFPKPHKNLQEELRLNSNLYAKQQIKLAPASWCLAKCLTDSHFTWQKIIVWNYDQGIHKVYSTKHDLHGLIDWVEFNVRRLASGYMRRPCEGHGVGCLWLLHVKPSQEVIFTRYETQTICHVKLDLHMDFARINGVLMQITKME